SIVENFFTCILRISSLLTCLRICAISRLFLFIIPLTWIIDVFLLSIHVSVEGLGGRRTISISTISCILVLVEWVVLRTGQTSLSIRFFITCVIKYSLCT